MTESSKKHQNSALEKYVLTKGRTLPLRNCYINEEWEDTGSATIIVCRNQEDSHITFGIFLVDTFCLGLKDSTYKCNIKEEEFEDLLDEISQEQDLLEIDYLLAHNIIYGAIAFANEFGFKPHESFDLTRFLLQEDNDQIDMLDVSFGIDNKPAILTGENNPQTELIEHLNNICGEGNFIILHQNEEEEDEDEDMEEDDDSLLGSYSDYSNEELLEQIEGSDQQELSEILGLVFELYVRIQGVDKFDELFDKYAPDYEKLEVVNDFNHPMLEFLPDEQMIRFYEIQEILNESPRKAVKEIEKTLESFQHPVFYNLLFSAHVLLEENEKAFEILEITLKTFPNDLMTRINYAYSLLEREQYNTIKLFMSGFEISKLLPDRNVVHINEISELLNLACQYFAHTNQLLIASVFQEILDSYSGIPPMVFDYKLQTFEMICDLQLLEINTFLEQQANTCID